MKKIERIKGMWPVIVCAGLLLAAVLLLWAARAVPGFAEWYSKSIYPVLVTCIGGVFGLIPVSVVEWLLYGGIVLVIVLLIKYRRNPAKLFQSYG